MNSYNATWPGGMPAVGQSARRSRNVSTRDITLFTEISGDKNPLHYDEKAAKGTRFAGIVVQGGITSAILNAVVAEDLPGPGSVFLQVTWSFKAPVRPGDNITGEVKITKVREDKPITEMETRVFLADGTLVLDGSAVCYTMPIAG
jgi:acyl dehydratase